MWTCTYVQKGLHRAPSRSLIRCSAQICVSLYHEKTQKENYVHVSKQYLAFVMLFLAATSLAVSGSGSDVGMGEFWKKGRRIMLISKLLQQLKPRWLLHSGDLQRDLALDSLFQLIWRQSRTLGKCLVSSPGLVRACILEKDREVILFSTPCRTILADLLWLMCIFSLWPLGGAVGQITKKGSSTIGYI